MSTPEIDELRREIDDLDRRVVDLLRRRLELVLAVGDVKRRKDLPVHDPERERQMLERLSALASAPLDGPTVRRIFERIIEESRRMEGEHVRR